MVAFCIVLLLPSNHAYSKPPPPKKKKKKKKKEKEKRNDINNTVALVEHSYHQVASTATVNTDKATILHHLITLLLTKWVEIEIFADMDTSSVIFKLP